MASATKTACIHGAGSTGTHAKPQYLKKNVGRTKSSSTQPFASMRTALAHTIAPSTMRKTASAATSVGLRSRSLIIVGDRRLGQLEVEDGRKVGLHRRCVSAERVEQRLGA